MAAILADDNFKCIFFNQNDRIPIRVSLKFVHRSPIDNITALAQVMAWHRLANNRTNADPFHWRIYAALGGDDLKLHSHSFRYILRCIVSLALGQSCDFAIVSMPTKKLWQTWWRHSMETFPRYWPLILRNFAVLTDSRVAGDLGYYFGHVTSL